MHGHVLNVPAARREKQRGDPSRRLAHLPARPTAGLLGLFLFGERIQTAPPHLAAEALALALLAAGTSALSHSRLLAADDPSPKPPTLATPPPTPSPRDPSPTPPTTRTPTAALADPSSRPTPDPIVDSRDKIHS